MLLQTIFCPHPPLLIPSIGKENLNQLSETINAFNLLNKKIVNQAPETFLVISPHGKIFSQAFSINLNPEYEANFNQFGDFASKLEFSPDTALIDQLKDEIQKKWPLNLTSNAELDHGVSVPLYYLTKEISNFKIIPFGYSLLSLKTHFQLGRKIGEFLQHQAQKTAVIASGDLSHCLSEQSPGGFCPQGKEFDEKLINFLLADDFDQIINFKPEFVNKAGECGLRSMVILMGIAKQLDRKFNKLAYQAPFGVGYLTGEFI